MSEQGANPPHAADSQSGATAGTEPLALSNGQVIFTEGADSTCAYLVLQGAVELSKQSEDGPIRLAVLRAGALFGEMGLIDRSPRSATARALGPTTLQPIDRETFLANLRQNPAVTLPLLGEMVRRLRSTSELLEQRRSDPAALEYSAFARFRRSGPLRRLFSGRRRPVAAEFKPPWVEIEERQTPVTAHATLFSLAALVVIGALWAGFAEIDRIVTAEGRIVTRVPNVVLQPIETGVIRQIAVRPGQRVKQGEVLATLDPTFALADLQAATATLDSLDAEIARLQAEVTGSVPERFATIPELESLQRRVFERRQAEVASVLLGFEAEAAELKAQKETAALRARTLEGQIAVLSEVASMRSTLLERGAGSRLQALEARGDVLELRQQLDQLRRVPAEIDAKAAQVAARRSAYLGERQSKVAEDLVLKQRQRDQLAEESRKMQARSAMISIVAPADGVVLSLAELAVGSVIREAERLMTLVPLNVPMEVEIDVNPRDIGTIRVGDAVRVKLDALPFQRHGTLTGTLRVIGENTIEVGEGERRGNVYRSLVSLPDTPGTELRSVPEDFRLIPGMSVTAEVRVGQRSVLSYFLYPVLRTLDEGLREP